MEGDHHPLPSSSAAPFGYVTLFLLRPFLAVSFVLSFILLGWILAWKLVLVHVPLVQEIFGLRKKHFKPKPPHRHRYSKYYSSIGARDRVDDSRVNSSPS
ncbi:hypothetical protein MLD38_001389 [Melastoma candidum]|uniref:Uncharacterized protein n=1 Tax=Melastoma candidum TaxID=119954 RepID=A0ACB9SED8_9MYRT|nr:hypothetical protein MLD38_001389 [Melastoma candidum]